MKADEGVIETGVNAVHNRDTIEPARPSVIFEPISRPPDVGIPSHSCRHLRSVQRYSSLEFFGAFRTLRERSPNSLVVGKMGFIESFSGLGRHFS